MPGAVSELNIGPFSGGINQFSDKSAIADNELDDCINFDVDLDGSLKSRPPWSLLYGLEIPTTIGSPEQYQRIIGTYVYNGVRFLFLHTIGNGTTPSLVIYYVDGPNAGTTTTIPAGNIKYSTSVRYEDTIYFIPSPEMGAPGGYSYDLGTGTVTSLTAIPTGNSAIVYKDSLFVGGGNTTDKSRLYFSDLADFTSWPSSNFFDINPGDGDTLEDFLIYQDNILLAKDNATYVLSYDTTPAQAVLKNINTSIGVKGPFCLVPYENSVFFLQYSIVYEMVNYDFTRISTKLPFELDETIEFNHDMPTTWKFPVFLSNVGDRLVCRFYNRLYVYHLRIRSWTRWHSEDNNIQNVGPIVELDRTNSSEVQGYKTYVACSALTNVIDEAGHGSDSTYSKIFQMKDTYDSTTRENGNIVSSPVDIYCSIVTKVYDIGISHRFKRLMHWGVDMVTANDVTGTLYPFSIAYRVTWGQLIGKTWSELQTWGYPLFSIPSVSQTTPIINRVDRRFIRFPKSLRFRLLQFQIDVKTQGNTTDGPARIYTLTAFIGSKQLVPSAVN